MKKQIIGLAISIALYGTAVQASDINPADLGVTLTAAGSKIAAEGSLPAFEGRSEPESGWSVGKNRTDFWKYRDEKPLYTIDSSNVDQYAELLSPGQKQLFLTLPDYKMVVYPTHRSCSYPDFTIENTRYNVGKASVTSDGKGIEGAHLPGIPFPGTDNAEEAIWNHLTRYGGIGMDSVVRTVVSPRPGSDTFIDTLTTTTLYNPLGRVGSNSVSDHGSVYLAGFVEFLEPAAMSGTSMVQKSAFGKDQETFMYFPGQRRVRRMPTYAYDAPMLGFENQIMIDQSFTFNGSPERFEWNIVGEKEMVVPYNAFEMYDPSKSLDEVVDKTSVLPDVRRYEVHKVYVVEAKVKEGMRHQAPKRTFYLDSDTYLALAADDYNENGELARYRESYPMPVWELEGACALLPYSQYDLETGRYIADMLSAGAGAGGGMKWFIKSDMPRFQDRFYTQDNLRAVSR